MVGYRTVLVFIKKKSKVFDNLHKIIISIFKLQLKNENTRNDGQDKTKG